MQLLYFVIFVGALVLVHEVGHFLAARAFGVKVEELAFGFGPAVVRIRGKETLYALRLFPLGGYVRMLEAGRTERPLYPEEERRCFERLPAWKRAVVMLAGPAMNLAFPLVLYTGIYAGESDDLPPVVGTVLAGHPAEGKLEVGDVVTSIDGRDVRSFSEMQEAFTRVAGRPAQVVVDRGGARVEVTLVPTDVEVPREPAELGLVQHVGRAGIRPTFLAPTVGVRGESSPAARAGLRTFDRITAIDGKAIVRFADLAEALAKNRGDTLVLSYLRPRPVPALGDLGTIAILEPGVATLTPLPPGSGRDLPASAQAAELLRRTGLEPSELWVAFVPEGSSEARMGLAPGDRVTAVDGRTLGSFRDLEEALLERPDSEHELAWLRDDAPRSGTLRLRRETWTTEYGTRVDRYVFRTTNWAPLVVPRTIPRPWPVWSAVVRGARETKRTVEVIGTSLVRLLQGKVSLVAVGGPIALYDVAGDASTRGGSDFAWALAALSVNLGLVNLLPVPVLDGGALLLLALERVRGRPLGLGARKAASLAGMIVIGLLLAVAVRNDVVRKWDVVRAELGELVGR